MNRNKYEIATFVPVMPATKCSTFFPGQEVFYLETAVGCAGPCGDELGLPVTQEQVSELEATSTISTTKKRRSSRKNLRHDVMAHIHTYGLQCPKAMPIIHLGATSCYVGDNTDVILMREALCLVRDELVRGAGPSGQVC